MSDKTDRLDGTKATITSPSQLSPALAKPEDFPIEIVIPGNGQRGNSETEYRRLLAAKHPRPHLLDYP
jgi:hypothetical protein